MTTNETPKLHKLLNKWTYWFDTATYQPTSGADNTGIEEIFTFDTVEHFWMLQNEIPRMEETVKGASMYLLKSGVSPQPTNFEKQYHKVKFQEKTEPNVVFEKFVCFLSLSI